MNGRVYISFVHMEHVRSLVLKGLMEGLALHAIEREPTHGYGILKQLEGALGERPSKNQVYPLLRELEEAGLVEAESAEGSRQKQVYHLTAAGEERLADFRRLPRPFKNRLAGLFGMPHLSDGPVSHHPEEGPEPEPPVPAADEEAETSDDAPHPARLEAHEAWVPLALEQLPSGPEIKAPFANVSVERNPAQGTWSLTVEQHDPARYEGATRCPLTFLYLAMQQLLFEAELPEA